MFPFIKKKTQKMFIKIFVNNIFQVVPKGMYNLIMWIVREYNNPPIIVTENGVSDNGGLADYGRVDYLNSYLSGRLTIYIF